jgi:hypothetical protein
VIEVIQALNREFCQRVDPAQLIAAVCLSRTSPVSSVGAGPATHEFGAV